jgi:HEPN domain-containing protein
VAGDEEDERQPESAEDWAALARRKLSSARHLFQIRQNVEAYVQCGFAVECALKARIMTSRRLNRWPDFDAELFTHDLPKLLALAGLEADMLAEATAASRVAENWMVAKDWHHRARYLIFMKPRRARDMLEATGETTTGLVEWILGR